MTGFLHELFANIFNGNVILATILIAILPVIEIRGALPFATNPGFWAEYTLTNWQAFGWSLLGSSIIVPILALLFVPLINLLKKIKLFKNIANSIENRVRSKAENIEGSNEKSKIFSRGYWKKFFAVLIFVSIPLPFTGVWTGTCIAVFIGLDYFSTCISVITGNIIAGLLITLILQFFPALNNYLFYIFIIFVALIILYEIIVHIIKKIKSKQSN